ncbi:MAG: hypothetical protein ACI35O_07565 [Bacillaceae bacterium]
MHNQYNDYYRSPQPSGYFNLGQQTFDVINPVITHAILEVQESGYQYALTEAVAMGYLMGKGYDYNTAWNIVKSWLGPPGIPLPISY